MAYARILETGTYIWSDEKDVHFGLDTISNKDIDIFLAKLYDNHNDEFIKRVENGRNLIEQHKLGDENE